MAMTFPEWLGLEYNITVSEFYELPDFQQILLENCYKNYKEANPDGDDDY